MEIKHLFLRRLGILKLTIIFLSLLTLHQIYRHAPTYLVGNRGLESRETVQAPNQRNFTVEIESKEIPWDQYKYVQIVSTVHELCSAVMVWKQIEAFGSRAGRIMLYPSNWPSLTPLRPSNATSYDTNSSPKETENEFIARLLLKASKEFYVSLVPSHNRHELDPQLQAFNLTSHKRILLLGPTAISVLGQLDEIFLAPSKTEDDGIFMAHTGSQLTSEGDFLEGVTLLHPSTSAFTNVTQAAQNGSLRSPTVLDILKNAFPPDKIGKLNTALYGFHTSSLLLHPPLPPLSYFSASYHLSPEVLSYFPSLKPKPPTPPLTLLKQTKIIHFSHPSTPSLPSLSKSSCRNERQVQVPTFMRKPWIKPTQQELNTFMPPCKISEQGFGATDCEDRRVWIEFWGDYRVRRKEVCGFQFGGWEESRGYVGLGDWVGGGYND